MFDIDSIPADLPLFDGIPADKVHHVLRCLNVKPATIEKDRPIFNHASPVGYTGYLWKGKAFAVRVDQDGNRSILCELHPGSVIAAEHFFRIQNPAPIDVIAAEPCLILLFNLTKQVEAKPCCMVHVNCVKSNLVSSAMQTNNELLGRLEVVSNRSTREKVLAYLGNQAKHAGCASFDIPISRQELADLLYVERSALSRELSKLQKEGLISFRGKHFELHFPVE